MLPVRFPIAPMLSFLLRLVRTTKSHSELLGWRWTLDNYRAPDGLLATRTKLGLDDTGRKSRSGKLKIRWSIVIDS